MSSTARDTVGGRPAGHSPAKAPPNNLLLGLAWSACAAMLTLATGCTTATTGVGGQAGGQVAGNGGANGGQTTTTTDTPTTAPLHFVVYGDSRSNPDQHQKVVDAFAAVNPDLVIATGDLWDGYDSTRWASIINKNANIAALLRDNRFLVSRGNHETVGELLGFQPTLVRDGAERYAFTYGNSFFVSMGMDPAADTAYLEQQLKSSAAQQASYRFVFSHYPIYSAGPHGGSGDATIEGLCDKYAVAIYFCGHDHLYERSHQMRGGVAVNKGNDLRVADGSVYVVTGGGGAPLYDTGKIPSTHYTLKVLHFVDVVASAASLTVTARKTDGAAIDTFTVTR